MVAIFTGSNTGVETGSGMVLGSRGLLGQASLGRANEGVFVNAATGNLVISRIDEMLMGMGPDIAIANTYNSLGNLSDDNGDNWRASASRKVVLTGTAGQAGSYITRTDWDGSVVVYNWDAGQSRYETTDGGGAYDSIVSVTLTAGSLSAGTYWKWTDGATQLTELYDSTGDGRLLAVVDPDVTTTSRAYQKFDYVNISGQNYIQKITTVNDTTKTTDDQFTTFNYTGTAITSIVTSYRDSDNGTVKTLTRVRYGYDGSGRLSTVTVDLTPNDNSVADNVTYVTTFTYDGASKRVASISQTDGSSLTIAYDGSNRVQTLTQLSSSGVSRVTSFAYNTGNTVVTDPAGQATTLTYDTADGKLLSVSAPPAVSGGSAQVTTFTYSANDDVESIEDPSGRKLVFSGYGPEGLYGSQRDSAGNVVDYTYNGFNQVLTATAYTTAAPLDHATGTPSGALVSRNVYDGHRLRFSVSAEGRVVEYGYDGTGFTGMAGAAGSVTSVIEYAGNLYTGGTFTLTDLQSWVTGLSDKSANRRIDTTYNFRGDVEYVKTYATTQTNGAGDTSTVSTLYYIYDQAGNLLQRQLVGATATETYVYDGLNRITASTDFNGLKTTVAFADSTATTTMVIGSTITRTSVFNLAGELLSVAESASGVSTVTATYRYDSMGRLRGMTDPSGVKTYYLYDHLGRRTAEIQGDGSVVEFGYDADGRLIKTVRYKNLLNSTQLTDLYGIDDTADAGVPDVIGAFRPSSDAADIWQWTVYDKAGRVLQTIDAIGGVTGYVYDGASRLVKTIRYFNTVSTSGLKTTAPLTAVSVSTNSADRTTRYLYDADGLMVGTLDAEGYLKEFKYDNSGKVIETIAYDTVTNSTHWASGTLSNLRPTAVNSKDVHVWSLYDRRGLLRATIGGEGTVVRYEYDGFGRATKEIRGQQLSSTQLDAILAAPTTPPTLASLPSVISGQIIETTEWTRDHYGKVLSEVRTLATGAKETDIYVYDGFGRLMNVTTATGTANARTRSFMYDNRGRLTGELSGEGSAILGSFANWTYDQTFTGTSAIDTIDRSVAPDTYTRDLILGLGGNDILRGGGGDDRIEGGAGNDNINGGVGNDVIIGGLNTDTLTGGAGRDIFVFASGDGVDTIQDFEFGIDLIDLTALGGYLSIQTSATITTDVEILLSNAGKITVKNAAVSQFTAASFLYGGYDQVLVGTASTDTITGGGGRDLIQGLAGNDTLSGDGGDDRLDGAAGTDILSGGGGDDVVVSGANNDTSISGGAGRDVFVFGLGDSTANTVTDFVLGSDLIDLQSVGSYTSMVMVGANSVITLSDGSKITVNGVTLTSDHLLMSALDVFKAYGVLYAYDDSDRMISKTESDGSGLTGNKTLYYYDTDGNLTYEVNALGEVVEYRYDTFGRQTDVVVYTSRISTTGLTGGAVTTGLTTLLGANYAFTHTDYTVRSEVSKVTDGEGGWTSFTYNSFGEVSAKSRLLSGTSTTVDTSYLYNNRGLMYRQEVDSPGLNLVTQFGYDAFGRAVSETDPKSVVQTNGYDREHRVITRIVDQGSGKLNLTTRYSYDGRNHVTSMIEGYGTSAARTTTYETDEFGRNSVTKIGVVSGTPTMQVTTVRNAYGETVSVTQGATVITYVYDRSGRLRSQTDALGNAVQNSFDRAGRLAEVIDARGVKTVYAYDAANRIVTETVDPTGLNLVTTYNTYNTLGQVLQVTDAGGRVTAFAYDKTKRTTTVTQDPSGLGLQTIYTYDKAGRTTRVETTATTGSASSRKVDYVYDKADRLLQVIVDPGGLNLTTVYTYDRNGNTVATTDPAGKITRFVYDNANRLVWTVDATGAVTRTVYDETGLVTRVRAYPTRIAAGTLAGLPLEISVSNLSAYNVTETAGGGERVTAFTYDAAGRLRFSIDANRAVTENVYDGVGNIIRQIAYADAIAWAASYDDTGVNSHVTTTSVAGNTRNRTTRAVYDAANRQVYAIDASNALTAFTYDASGNVTKTVKFAAAYTSTDQTLAAVQSWAGNVANISAVNDRLSRMVYDNAGRLIFSAQSYKYNTTNSKPTSILTAFTYDGSGNLVRTTQYSAAHEDAADLTAAGLASWVTTNASATLDRTTRVVFDAANRATFSIDGMGYVSRLTYDASSNAIKSTRFVTAYGPTTDPTDATMASWASTYAHADDVIERTYYDGANRAKYALNGEGYLTKTLYNTAGDATDIIRFSEAYASQVSDSTTIGFFDTDTSSIPSDAVVTQFTYDAMHRVLTQVRGAGTTYSATTTYEYDAFGQVTKVINPRSIQTTYTYNTAGQLTSESVGLGGGSYATTTYVNNTFGERVKVTDPRGFVGYFYYDQLGRMDEQVDPEGYVTKTAFSLGGEVIQVDRYHSKPNNTPDENTRPTFGGSPVYARTLIGRDKLDRVISTTDADNKTESYKLNAFGDRIEVTNKLTGMTAYEFDRRGLMTKETLPVTAKNGAGTSINIVNTFSYDSRGNRLQAVEGVGLTEVRTTTFTYDKLDRLLTETGDAMTLVNDDLSTTANQKMVQRIIYDPFGNIVGSQVDRLDVATQVATPVQKTFYFWDEMGRKTAEVNHLGRLSVWEYDTANNNTHTWVYDSPVASLPSSYGGTAPSAVNPSNVRHLEMSYDGNNRIEWTKVTGLTTGQYVSGSYTTSTSDVMTYRYYDAMGNVLEEKDGRGNSTFHYYDKAGREIARVDQEKYLTWYERDSEGNVTKEERFATKLTATVDRTLNATAVAALRTSVAGAAGDRITEFSYDLMGRRTEERRLLVSSWTVASGLMTEDDASSGTSGVQRPTAVIKYQYDALGNVTKKTEANLDITEYTYDVIGRQTKIQGTEFTDNASTLVRNTVDITYDGLGNVLTTREGKATVNSTIDRVTTYTYGAGGRLATMTDAAGFQRTFGYDLFGRITQEKYLRVKSDGTTVSEAKAYKYDSLGQMIQQSIATESTPNSGVWTFGIKTHLRYNLHGELTGKGMSSSTAVYQETFEYDKGGRMWRSNAGDGSSRIYGYDANGAATLTINSDGTDLSTFTSFENAVSTIGTNAIGGSYVADTVAPSITVYDKRGQATSTVEKYRELTTSGTSTITKSKVYNAFGEVIQETDARGNVTDYAYNTMGRMVQKTLAAVSITGLDGAVTTNYRGVENYYYDISGRLVGVRDANGNLSRRELLAGTGHGDDEAKVLADYRPGASDTDVSIVARTAYDVFGDARKLTNEMGYYEERAYDKMGRLTEQKHIARSSTSTQLIDYYAYDGLGQRTQHWNSQFGSSYKEKTDYDYMGRVIKVADYLGNLTQYAYAWDAGQVTTGLGTFGGWTRTTTHVSGLTATEKLNYFGNLVGRTDYGAGTYALTFDKAARLTRQVLSRASMADQVYNFTYFNTGKMASKLEGEFSSSGMLSTYSYDVDGNQLTETQKWTVFGTSYTTYYLTAVVTWDGLNRMSTYDDATHQSSVDYEYDAVGNVRHMVASSENLATGSGTMSQDYWYKYDQQNRVITTAGVLSGTAGVSGTTIVRGYQGQDITYDKVGNRLSLTRTYEDSVQAEVIGQDSWYDQYENVWYYTDIYNYRDGDYVEYYTYTEDNFLKEVSSAGSYWDGSQVVLSPTSTLIARDVRDAMGRVTNHKEYNSGTIIRYERTVEYNQLSLVTKDYTRTFKHPDEYWHSDNTYTYTQQGAANGIANGAFLGGAVTYIYNDLYHYGSIGGAKNEDVDSNTTYTYIWRDGALQSQIVYDRPGNNSNWTSNFTYDVSGRLTYVNVADGRPRQIYYEYDNGKQIIHRYETSYQYSQSPIDWNFFFGGIRIGQVSNNGPTSRDYMREVYSHGAVSNNTGPFLDGTTTYPQAFLDFDQSIIPMNVSNTAGANTSYSANEGDTLQSIALATWGDAGLWYLIADANGMTGTETILDGQGLLIPTNVFSNRNSADTFRPYNPNEAIGNVSPTSPKPPPKPKQGCGVIGSIIMIVVAVIVTIYCWEFLGEGLIAMWGEVFAAIGWTGAAATGAATFAAGATIGAIASAASQGVGLAIGAIDKFSWSEVARAAIMAGIDAVGGIPMVDVGDEIANGFVNGAISSTVSQGVAVAVGAQDEFSWTAVAAAGVTSAVTVWANKTIGEMAGNAAASAQSNPIAAGEARINAAFGDWGRAGKLNFAVSGAAGMLAGAATQSLLDGSDFGDNVMSALPNYIVNTIGRMVTTEVNAAETERLRKATIDAYYEYIDATPPLYTATNDGTGFVIASQDPQTAIVVQGPGDMGKRVGADGKAAAGPGGAAPTGPKRWIVLDPSPPVDPGKGIWLRSRLYTKEGDAWVQAKEWTEETGADIWLQNNSDQTLVYEIAFDQDNPTYWHVTPKVMNGDAVGPTTLVNKIWAGNSFKSDHYQIDFRKPMSEAEIRQLDWDDFLRRREAFDDIVDQNTRENAWIMAPVIAAAAAPFIVPALVDAAFTGWAIAAPHATILTDLSFIGAEGVSGVSFGIPVAAAGATVGYRVYGDDLAEVVSAADDIIARGTKVSQAANPARLVEPELGVPAVRSSDPLSPVQEFDAFGNEIRYRTMNEGDLAYLERTGQIRASSRSETSTSGDLSYAGSYDGVTVRFTLEPKTSSQLLDLGIAADKTVAGKFGVEMRSGAWTDSAVRFKLEGGQITTQLGRGEGLKIFNENMLRYEVLR